MNEHTWKRSFPCFSPHAAVGPSVLCLPLAPACNMQCARCSRRSDGLSDLAVSGITLSPDEAVEQVSIAVTRGAVSSGVVIWGPGEPLVHAQTFVALKKLSWLFPKLSITVGTNGLLLSDRIEELVRTGVRNIVLSLGAASPGTAERLYDWAIYHGRKYTGEDAARLVLQQQWSGLESAVEAGFFVTVYIADIAGVNGHEISEIKGRAEDVGAARVVVQPFSE